MKSFKFIFAVLIISCFSSVALHSQATLRILQPRGGVGSQPGSIDELIIRAIPQGAYIEYRAYIRFSARGSSYKSDIDSLEIEFKFKLPPNSFINDSWLWFDSTIVKAKIFDRWTAGLIYETTVGRWTN
ncbi:MAG: hypothetical protein Q8M94_00340, partial [Ignavibacteria bacterium]|nr:hypothetical protein [Ignavibacteria bacterium]